MNGKYIRLIAIFASSLASPAFPQSTGSDLLEECPADLGKCGEFTTAVLRGVDYGVTFGALIASEGDMDKFAEASDTVMAYCLPAGTTNVDMGISVYSQILEDEKLKEADAVIAIVTAMKRSYPCE